jgi:hypothetical protein
MIQCLKCNRVWPTGTVWCGICKATLGVKLCPDGHVNQTVSQCCTSCGKSPLSPYCPCRNLRVGFKAGLAWLLLLCTPFVFTLTIDLVNFIDRIAHLLFLWSINTICFQLLVATLIGNPVCRVRIWAIAKRLWSVLSKAIMQKKGFP